MYSHPLAIVKSLVAVVWADGKIAEDEENLIHALAVQFGLGPADVATIREFAKTKRTLDDAPLGELNAAEKSVVLEQAVRLTFIDGEQSTEEKELIKALVSKLGVKPDDVDGAIASGLRHAKGFLR